jgi:hypothetical protein
MRRFQPVLGVALLFALLITTVQAAPTARREYTESASGPSQSVKFPSVAVTGDQVAVGYSSGDAAIKIKSGGAQGFDVSASYGKTGNPTYFNHTIATGPQVGVYHSVRSENGSRLHYRNTVGVESVVADGLEFAHFVDVAVASNGRIYVVWRTLQDESSLFASFSDDGRKWAPPILVTNTTLPLGRPRLAAGPNNTLYLAFGSGKGDIFVGQWNGSNFQIAQVTQGGAFEADPTVTVAPSGTVYAAWRGVGEGPFVAELTSGGWSVQRLSGGDAAGPVAIDADAGGNLHAAWSGSVSGEWEVYYRVRLAGQDWSEAVNASVDGGVYDINVDVVGTPGSTTVGHVAFEAFQNGVEIRYARLVTQGGAVPEPVPPAPQPQPSQPPADARLFPETNQYISGRIRQYWEGNGGLPVFGIPLNAEAQRKTLDGTYQMQTFERNRLELHPENAAPYDVLLGRLGGDLLYKQGRAWETLPREQPKAGCKFFAETQHNLCEPFLSYWRTFGLELGDPGVSERESLALWGLPLTTAGVETNPDGFTGLTQWFERARFELHPENPDPYKILLGRLGAEAGE